MLRSSLEPSNRSATIEQNLGYHNDLVVVVHSPATRRPIHLVLHADTSVARYFRCAPFHLCNAWHLRSTNHLLLGGAILAFRLFYGLAGSSSEWSVLPDGRRRVRQLLPSKEVISTPRQPAPRSLLDDPPPSLILDTPTGAL